jgi:hypothetical protein
MPKRVQRGPDQSAGASPGRPSSRRPRMPGPEHRAGTQPPGLDDARHAAAQRAAQQADILDNAAIPAMMATALQIPQVAAAGFRVYLDRLLADAGDITDPVEIMLLEQLAMAHFRIGQLHGAAGQAQTLEGTKLLSAAAARLLGEFRRTALAIRAYRHGVPEGKSERQLKLRKLAE